MQNSGLGGNAIRERIDIQRLGGVIYVGSNAMGGEVLYSR